MCNTCGLAFHVVHYRRRRVEWPCGDPDSSDDDRPPGLLRDDSPSNAVGAASVPTFAYESMLTKASALTISEPMLRSHPKQFSYDFESAEPIAPYEKSVIGHTARELFLLRSTH